jgi:hypothetical protein
MKRFNAYWQYTPALLTLFGACLVATGIFLGDGSNADEKDRNQFIRLCGAVLAATGAFWSGHRQILSSARNKERDERLLSLSEDVRGNITGGSSYCYAQPMMTSASEFQWIFIHQGEFPLFDVSVRIYDFRDPITISRTIPLGTLFPGMAQAVGAIPGAIFNRTPAQAFNLFFVARNGSWTQEIRWVELPSMQATANRVIRNGQPQDKPLLFEVSPEYPGRAPAGEPWNDPPPGLIRNGVQ